jgi:hypothetical protein
MARPRLFDVAVSRNRSVRLTAAQARELEDVARDNATNVGDVIREAVNEYVSDYRERVIFPAHQPYRRRRRASS